MKNLCETDKAYIAGLLDGEGCIGIDRIKSKNKTWEYDFRIRIVITNKDENVICWLKCVTGIGCAYIHGGRYKENWNIIHRWQAVSEKAREFLLAVRPYLRIKKDVCDIVLTLPKLDSDRKFYGRTAAEYTEQFRCYQIAKTKNIRGRALTSQEI